MERIVYFQDKALCFSSKAIPEGFFPWPFDARETGVRAKVINFLETHNKVCLLADDPEAAFEHFAAEFSWVEAAGGLVEAEHGAGVLMIYRNGRWDLPKGKVEQGETHAEALMRECREELDIAVAVGEPFMDVTHRYPDIHVHLTLYHAALVGGTPRLLEHADAAWITPAQVDDYPFCPADTAILERIKEEFE